MPTKVFSCCCQLQRHWGQKNIQEPFVCTYYSLRLKYASVQTWLVVLFSLVIKSSIDLEVSFVTFLLARSVSILLHVATFLLRCEELQKMKFICQVKCQLFLFWYIKVRSKSNNIIIACSTISTKLTRACP